MRYLSVALVVLFAGTASSQALNDQGPPQHRIVYRASLTARVNPLGLLVEGRIAYRFRLYESQSPALRDNFIGAGAFLALSPAFINIGPYIEFQPLSVLGFWATYQYSRYFRTFGLFQSFPSAASSNFSDVEISRRAALPRTDPASNYMTDGAQLMIGADFQVKLGPIVLRDRARLVRSDYSNMRSGDTVFYEQYYDVLAPNRGWYISNDVDVMWVRNDNRLFIGARYTAASGFFTGDQYLAGEQVTNLNATHRVGPLAGYSFKAEDGARFNNPTVFALVQWWLVHRYRTGQVSSQGLPMIGIGFSVNGDLIPFAKK